MQNLVMASSKTFAGNTQLKHDKIDLITRRAYRRPEQIVTLRS